MGKVGFQDYWVAGSRLLFQADPDSNGVIQPTDDIGTIESANPTVTPTEIQVSDPDGGVKRILDRQTTQVDEEYDIVVRNLNLRNLSRLFLAEEPVDFSQTAAELILTSSSLRAWPERLLKLIDNDNDGTPLYSFDSVFGVVIPGDKITTDTGLITAISPTAGTITVSSDLTTNISPGDDIIIHRDGLTDARNARTIRVSAITSTTITTTDKLFAAESGVTVDITYADNASGSTGKVLAQKVTDAETGRDWEVYSAARGLVRFLSGAGTLTEASYPTGVDVNAYTHQGAIASGKRLFKPQSSTTIRGRAIIIWSRGGFEDQTVRECRVAITPNASNIQNEDFSSITLRVTVLTDVGREDPAGRVVQVAGSTAAQS